MTRSAALDLRRGIVARHPEFAVFVRQHRSRLLFHHPVRVVVEGVLRSGAAAAWPGVALYVGASLAVGTLAYPVVEQPTLGLRDRLVAAMAVVRTAAVERGRP